MSPHTIAIIRGALQLDQTIEPGDRARILADITAKRGERVRINFNTARTMLGISRSTFLRRLADEPSYRALDVQFHGKPGCHTKWFFRDEIQNLRDSQTTTKEKK